MILNIEQPIDLDHTFRCGQAFRWVKSGEWYSGVVEGILIKLRHIHTGSAPGERGGGNNNIIEWECGGEYGEKYIKTLLGDYFRLDDDYEGIIARICRDEYIEKAVKKYHGLRLLRQEPWECLVSYLCSARNSIGQIRKCIENLSMKFGKKLSLGNMERYSFPTLSSLAKASEEELRECGTGFRARYISAAAREIFTRKIELQGYRNISYARAKGELLKFKGVGPKIADCVLAFSMDKMEAFPIDRWMRRAMMEQYSHKIGPLKRSTDEKNNDERISHFAREHFGTCAAYAQEYIFYYRRV